MSTMRELAVQPDSAIRADVVALYEEAFPPEERIELGILDELANEPGVEFTAYCDDGACMHEISCALKGLLPFELVACPS